MEPPCHLAAPAPAERSEFASCAKLPLRWLRGAAGEEEAEPARVVMCARGTKSRNKEVTSQTILSAGR